MSDYKIPLMETLPGGKPTELDAANVALPNGGEVTYNYITALYLPGSTAEIIREWVNGQSAQGVYKTECPECKTLYVYITKRPSGHFYCDSVELPKTPTVQRFDCPCGETFPMGFAHTVMIAALPK